MTTQAFAVLAGPIARAMAEVHRLKKPDVDVSGTIPCTRCGSPLRFNIQPKGISRGQCASAGCVRWCE